MTNNTSNTSISPNQTINTSQVKNKIGKSNNLYNINNSKMYDKNLSLIVSELDLNEFEKSIFFTRINEMLTSNINKINKYKFYTKILRFIMQIFSIILTFTLSISSFIGESFINYLNLILLFMLTVATNIFFQSKIGEKYLTYKRAYIKINHELWSYIMLINDYDYGDHKSNLNLFLSNVEKLYNTEFMEILDMIKQSNNSILSNAQGVIKSKLNDGNNKTDNNNSYDLNDESFINIDENNALQ
jgi:hypothetical protein